MLFWLVKHLYWAAAWVGERVIWFVFSFDFPLDTWDEIVHGNETYTERRVQ